jgi:L-iditol 2-dehydrogenase
MAVPSSMDAIVLVEPGRLELRTVPVPEPGPGELLLRVHAATTCGTDLKAFHRGHPQIPMPGPLGHEYAGTVVAAGPGAKYTVGDEVMGVHSAPCQACRWCLRGQENLCESIMATKVLGAYAPYLLIPARIARLNVFAKPAELPWNQAALLEPLACVAQGVSLLPLRPDDRVLVIGPGAIGLMFVAALRALGVGAVHLAGRNPRRLMVGEQLGAHIRLYADLNRENTDYDVVIEGTGMGEVWERSVEFSRRGGTVMLFGGCPSGTQVSFDAGRLHYDQITLVSPFHFGTGAVRQAATWLSDRHFDLSPLITGERRLDEAEQTFADLTAGLGIKYAFRP